MRHNTTQITPLPKVVAIAVVVLQLLQLFQTVGATYVCGDQMWFSGWLSSHQVTYQEMDVSVSHDFVAIGGYTMDISSFYLTVDSVSMDDSQAAVMLVYELASKEPYAHYIISRWLEGSVLVKILGFRQVSM